MRLLTAKSMKIEKSAKRALQCSFVAIALFAGMAFAQESPEDRLASAIASAESEEQRDALLAQNKEVKADLLMKALTAQAERLRAKREFERTLSLYRFIIRISEKSGDKSSIALGYNGVGVVQFTKGEYETALSNYQKALALREELGDKAGIASSLSNIGLFFRTTGDLDRALDYYRRGLENAEAAGRKDLISQTLNFIGNALRLQGDYEGAMEALQKSMKMKEELGDELGVAQTLGNIGNLYKSQGAYKAALEAYLKSLSICEKFDNKTGISQNLNNIGSVYLSQDDYRKALKYYEKSLDLKTKLGDKGGISSSLENLGLLYCYQGNIGLANEYFRRSLSIKKEIGDKGGIAELLANFALAYRLSGKYADALDYYQQSLSQSKELNRRIAAASTLNGIGFTYFLMDDYEKALEYSQQGLALSGESGDKEAQFGALITIAAAYSLKNDPAKSLSFSERAVSLARQIGAQEALSDALAATGRSLRLLNRPEQARSALEESISLVEDVREQIAGGDRDQRNYFRYKLFPYYEMVELAVSQNKIEEALSYAEQAKARTLLDVMQGGKVEIDKAMTPQEKEQEQRLTGRIVSLNAQVIRESSSKEPNEARLKELKNLLQKARLDFEAFETNLYSAHSELKTLRGKFQSIRFEEAGRLLADSDGALIEFVSGVEKTLLFVLTKDGKRSRAQLESKVYEISIKRGELARLAEEFRRKLAERDIGFRDSARQLFDLLLKPAEAQLKGRRILVVVPDGPLWELPFQALVSSNNRYLIEECAIFYAPSLTSLREMERLQKSKRAAAPLTFLAFGNPALGERGSQKESLKPLPEAEEEVQKIGQLYGSAKSKIYIGAEAREERLKSEVENCRLLHIAAHGILNNASPMASYVLLSQTGGDDGEDGFLEAYELMRMSLKAEIVILSACETARGRVIDGEGLIGLSWALFVSGCPTTIVSQWKVESSSTSELMLEFHRIFKAKMQGRGAYIAKAEALRKASLKLLASNEYKHPFYWAGFVMVGDGF